MDRKEEQQLEIETLLSIYPAELKILSRENCDPDVPETSVEPEDDRLQFMLTISSSEVAAGDSAGSVIVTVWKFIFPDNYPDVPAEVYLIKSGDIPADSVEQLVDCAKSAAAENVGMASTFAVVSAIQDYLNQHAEECLNRMMDAANRTKIEEEEAERRKMEGTRVSVESFIVWKTKFEAERQKKTKIVVETTGTRRLTGRQMFQENANLDSSDLQLMEEGDEGADVDEREPLEDVEEDFDRELFEQELLNEHD